MKNPPDPGFSVRVDYIEPLKLTVTQAAISPEMAIRLDKAWRTIF